MPSLLDKLKEKALSAVLDEDRQKEWVASGFDKAIEAARSNLPRDWSEGELKSLHDTGVYALEKLEKHKGSLVELGKHGLRSTLIMLANGDYDGAAKHAALVTLRETASWNEVSATIIATAQAGNEAKRNLDQAREDAMDMLKDIGTSAAKAAVPLILAAI